ncbi:hypothetical protein [Kitasatospora sp. NPDC087315]|uniref:hypothetical protein n=1 Tax=Kitasatospora sp. NPDC087315 TaxID=3364069 RepID=UPI0038274D66
MTSLDNPGQHHVVITAEGFAGSVHLDGKNISKTVRGYSLQHIAGQPAQVVLHLKESTTAAFDGLARVAIATESPGPDIVGFLTGIDPDELAAAVFKRTDLDGGRNELTRAALRQLLDWAKGAS